MSFAHDIVMINETSIAVGSAVMDSMKNPQQKQVTVNDGIGVIAGHDRKRSIDEVNSTLSKLQDRQSSIGLNKNYKDPLRELVLISETPTLKPDNTYVSNVNILAKEASVLEHVKEVRLDQVGGTVRSSSLGTVPKPTDLSSVQPDEEMSNLTIMFQDAKDVVDPEKEKEFLLKLEELEESDSEGFGGERPVLGKISLIRRAKSAVSRTTFEQKTNDKHPLFHVAWEQRESVKRPQSYTHGIPNEKSETKSADAESPSQPDDEFVTVQEVKNHMEMFHLRKSIPPPEAKMKEEKSGKYSRARRSKTSKYNKWVQL